MLPRAGSGTDSEFDISRHKLSHRMCKQQGSTLEQGSHPQHPETGASLVPSGQIPTPSASSPGLIPDQETRFHVR